MNKESLEKIDPVKTLLFILLFVAISLFIIFVFIVPNAREYKKTKIEYLRYEKSVKNIENTQKHKEQEFDKFSKQNKKVVEALSKRFDENKFVKYASKFFSDVRLEKSKKQTQEEDFTIYDISVTSSIQTPNNFYDFLIGLSNYENIIKTEYPISMSSYKNTIKLNFHIRVYRSAD